MATVTLKDVRKNFGDVKVIKGVDLTVEDGTFVVFVGPSGCGKSTLLRLIAGLEDITSGTLEIDGVVVNDMEPKDRGIAMVFQSYAIFPHMTVRENVAFGLTINRVPKADKDAKVAEAARILQMEHLLERRPSQLSGGQRQRVAIGRAIVRDPKVFLFDEPLSNLDAALRMDMRMEIGKLHQSLSATMIYVTHDQVEAMTLADKIVVLKDGEVMQSGTPMELYHRPANRFVAGFLGSPSMNFLTVDVLAMSDSEITVQSDSLKPLTLALSGTVSETLPEDSLKPTPGDATGTHHEQGVRLITAGGSKPDKVVLGIRPQYLLPDNTGNGMLTGTVLLTERLGSETIVDVALSEGGKVIAAISEDCLFDAGTPISLRFDPARAHLFPQEPS